MSRRALVQAKRKRLGLDVNGKIAPFHYVTSDWFRATIQGRAPKIEDRFYKPTRTQCLRAAMQADRIFTRFHMHDVSDEWRLQVIKNWMYWQMRVSNENT